METFSAQFSLRETVLAPAPPTLHDLMHARILPLSPIDCIRTERCTAYIFSHVGWNPRIRDP
jgi:hypothetical protein